VIFQRLIGPIHRDRVLDNFTKEPEREAKFTMSKIQYFDTKRLEHLDKFVAGEVDSFDFPPPETP